MITVQTKIKAPLATCWETWSNPAAILEFNNPFDDWHTSKVNIDFREGGKCYYRMAAKDGSDGFDFTGVYTSIIPHQLIEIAGDDGRKTINRFVQEGDYTLVSEMVEPDSHTPMELQINFCQHILDSFKQYVEEKLK